MKFSGIPGGHEINSFVLGILHLAAEDKLTAEQIEKIRQLPPNTTLKVGVTLACPYCPDVVAAAHSIAIASGGNVTAEMMNVALFPDIREKYHIMSVPALIVNGNEQALWGAVIRSGSSKSFGGMISTHPVFQSSRPIRLGALFF